MRILFIFSILIVSFPTTFAAESKWAQDMKEGQEAFHQGEMLHAEKRYGKNSAGIDPYLQCYSDFQRERKRVSEAEKIESRMNHIAALAHNLSNSWQAASMGSTKDPQLHANLL
jgi:hypothetical protein